MASLDMASNDDLIRLNMEVFLSYICNCIQMTDILTHMHNYTQEQRKELFTESRQNNSEACRKALHLLLNEFQEPGRFVAFKEAMATCGYPFIVKLLEGECVPYDENCRKIIQLFTSTVVPCLNPEEILPCLESQGTLQANDAEKVRKDAMNHGSQIACWVLLFHLPNRVENWFRYFMEALIDARYNELAHVLEPDMYEKIMTQRNVSSNLEHSDAALASGLALHDGLEGRTIGQEDLVVGEMDSMPLLSAPAPKSIIPNVSNITRADYCTGNVDGKGNKCDLSLTLNMEQTESKSAGNKHFFHSEDSLTHEKELARMEQYTMDETHLKRTVGTQLKVTNEEASAMSRSFQTEKDNIDTYLRTADTNTKLELVSDIKEDNINSEIQPPIPVNDLDSCTSGNGEYTEASSMANAVTVTEECADNLSMGTMETKRNTMRDLTNALDKDIRQNGGDEFQAEDQSFNFDIELNEDTHIYVNDFGSETDSSDEEEFFGGQNVHFLPEIMTRRRCVSNLEHSDAALASGIAFDDGLEGNTIQNEELIVGEKDSMPLLAAPAPKSISPNDSNITRADSCTGNVDGKGGKCDLSLTLNMEQTESKSVGIKHVFHDEDSLTHEKELARMEQHTFDKTHLKRTVGTKLKVKDKVTTKEASAMTRSSSTEKNNIVILYERTADSNTKIELVSDINEGNINSEIQPPIRVNALGRSKRENGENTDESAMLNAITVTEKHADNLIMGTKDITRIIDCTNALDKGINQNDEDECQEEDESLNFDDLLNEDTHGFCCGADSSEEEELSGGQDVNHLPVYVDDSKELNIDERNDLGRKSNNGPDTKVKKYDDEYIRKFNIKTDSDDVDDTEDTDVPLRAYQTELAKEGCTGDNVIVMAPTNTGKTRVAFKIMQEHLRTRRRQQRIGRVIFLVENKALALQQGKACAKTLPAYRSKIITGSLQRDKQQFLKDFVSRRDILIVTAGVLLYALKLKAIPSLTTFSMIVFDECHHTNNKHRFNEIMSRYMDLKLDENPDFDNLPQIVGLTASVGVNGKESEDFAMEHMKKILANLDAKRLCTVRQNKEELRQYENNPEEGIVSVGKRPSDSYRDAILQIMTDIDQYMINHPVMATLSKNDECIKTACRVPPYGGTQHFQQWLSKFAEALATVQSSDICSLLNPCREHLEVYNNALMIHADARRKDADTILEKFMIDQAVIESKVETSVMLMRLYNGLAQTDFSNEPENPKLLKLQELVWFTHCNNVEARGIIFVKTRELAGALTCWMNETHPLMSLNATVYVGQVAPAARGGTTKSKQRDVMELFEGGRHKVVFATSVAEEGLDIKKCNLVIRYETVTNEIVRVQSKGRARAEDSRYYVLTERVETIEKEEQNARLEILMNRIIPLLQDYIENNPNEWENELREIQEKKKLEEQQKAMERKLSMTPGIKKLMCRYCDNFICNSSDIRKIRNSHHVAIAEEVTKRLISKRGPKPQCIDDESMKFGGGVFCGNRECQRRLGGICHYKFADFPQITIKHFRVVDTNGIIQKFNQWTLANFEPEPFTLEDLRDVAVRLRTRNESVSSYTDLL